jgi:hypothetical protein
MPTIFLHLGIFEPAQVGNFQSAKTGEFSTGTDIPGELVEEEGIEPSFAGCGLAS